MPYYFSPEQKEAIKKAVEYAFKYEYKPEHDYVREFLTLMSNKKTNTFIFNNTNMKFAIEQLKIDYEIAKEEKNQKGKIKKEEYKINGFWD